VKIAVLTSRFTITGVPLAQMRLAHALARRGHIVELVVGHLDSECDFSETDSLTVKVLGKPKVRGMLPLLARYLVTEKPDVVFSAEDHLNTIVLLAAILSGSKAKISGSSRVTPFDTYSSTWFSKRWKLKHLSRAVMWRADALTCVSKDMIDQYREVFSAPPHVCVYNIVDDAPSRLRMREPNEHPWTVSKDIPLLIAAGSLAPWKGFSDLIRAFAILAARRPARLMILGDGPLREELQELANSLGLQDSFELMGYVSNPLKYFYKADVFILSSVVEGLPNVLVEAMMCGCTPVATDCPTGPREVLQGGRYGYLVPIGDAEAMASAIEQALDNPVPKALLDEAVAPFEESTVIDRHFEVLGICERSFT
jgi:glycosyltransferase involved in cell wall biosynthesis